MRSNGNKLENGNKLAAALASLALVFGLCPSFALAVDSAGDARTAPDISDARGLTGQDGDSSDIPSDGSEPVGGGVDVGNGVIEEGDGRGEDSGADQTGEGNDVDDSNDGGINESGDSGAGGEDDNQADGEDASGQPGKTSEGGESEQPAQPGDATDPEPEFAPYEGPTVELHRLADPYSCRHLYTASQEEAEATEAAGWVNQGIAWYAPETSDVPAYRVYNPYGGEHFYTGDASERDTLVSLGWHDEGVGFYSLSDAGVPIYRLYNLYNGDHHFTTSAEERDDLVEAGWQYENVAFRGAAAGMSYSGIADWAPAVVEDADTGVIAEGMVFPQQAMKGNSVQLKVVDMSSTRTARYMHLREEYAVKRTDALSIYNVKLVMTDSEGNTEQLKSGFGDLKLTFPIDESLEGEAVRITHLGTRDNGDDYVVGHVDELVEGGQASIMVDHLSEFIVAVGELEEIRIDATDNRHFPVQEMYRLYNPNSGEHFYTASVSERNAVVKAGWVYEGVGWIAPERSDTPVYRLYSGTDHHYTMSADERDKVVDAGWTYEGVGWYSDDAKGVPLLRQFNPYVQPNAPTNNSGSHNYTTSEEENDALVEVGWIAEGIGWYGVLQKDSEQEGSEGA